MKHYSDSLVGWFDFADIYSRMVAEAPEYSIFVEIGTANGKSAAFMCVEIANSGKQIQFHTVDIFPPENEQYNQELNVREHLKQFDFCYVHKSDGLEFLETVMNKSIQFLFLDGKHEVDPLIFELMSGKSKIKKGGYIGGHDYREDAYPDVKITVNSFCDFIKCDKEIINNSFLIKL